MIFLKGKDGKYYKKIKKANYNYVFDNGKWKFIEEDVEKIPDTIVICNVKIISQGQPRKYADSIYDYELVFKNDKIEEEVLDFVLKFLGEPKAKSTSEGPSWFEDRFSLHGNGSIWHYKRVSPYLD